MTDRRDCPKCDGWGHVKVAPLVSRACVRCEGTGIQRRYWCRECDGAGVVNTSWDRNPEMDVDCPGCQGTGKRAA